MEIYIATGIKQLGPHSVTEIYDLIQRKEIIESNLAWHEGLSDWVTVAEILQDALKPDNSADSTDSPSMSESAVMAVRDSQKAVEDAPEYRITPPPLPATSPSFLSTPVSVSPGITSEILTEDGGKKVIAGLLGIFLGGFGVHKFYLGYIKEGIIQLVATLVTCGFAAFVGLIEGIIYLTMSKETFVKTYIIGRKGWF